MNYTQNQYLTKQYNLEIPNQSSTREYCTINSCQETYFKFDWTCYTDAVYPHHRKRDSKEGKDLFRKSIICYQIYSAI